VPITSPVAPVPSNSPSISPIMETSHGPTAIPSQTNQQLQFYGQSAVNQNFATSNMPQTSSIRNALANVETNQAQYSMATNVLEANNYMQIVPDGETSNNDMQVVRNLGPQSSITRLRNNMDKKLTVLITYSRDAEVEAQKLIRVLWNAKIFGIVPRVMKDVNGSGAGDKVFKMCNKADYIVPIISPKYITDIGSGHLLPPDVRNQFVTNGEDDDLENQLWTVNIYDIYLNNFFNDGARNWKVYPVHLPEVSYRLRLNLHPVLQCSRKLFDEVNQLIRALKQ